LQVFTCASVCGLDFSIGCARSHLCAPRRWLVEKGRVWDAKAALEWSRRRCRCRLHGVGRHTLKRKGNRTKNYVGYAVGLI
jgi:hypothetical protein